MTISPLSSASHSRRHRWWVGEQAGAGYTFLLPALIHFAIFIAFPLGYAFYLSFQSWNMIEPHPSPVGLSNYASLFQDQQFLDSLIHTVTFTVGVMVGILILSLLVALALNQSIRAINLFRSIYFSPAVTSVILIGVIWLWMYNVQFGLFNQILSLIGLPTSQWVSDPSSAMPSLILTALWKNVGYFSVIFLAGLQGIDEIYYEAARIDGADRFDLFRRITFPLLMPTTFFVLVMGVILSFQVFGLVYVMTDGGPVNSTTVIVYYLYQQAFVFFHMGYASAMAYVLFAIIFVLTLLQVRFLGGYAEQ